MLMKICGLLGLSADYILYGDERKADESLSDKIHRIDEKYLPLLNKVIAELLELSLIEKRI